MKNTVIKMLVEFTFVEPTPDSFEDCKSDEQFADDICQFVADAYAEVGTTEYNVLSCTSEIVESEEK